MRSLLLNRLHKKTASFEEDPNNDFPDHESFIDGFSLLRDIYDGLNQIVLTLFVLFYDRLMRK